MSATHPEKWHEADLYQLEPCKHYTADQIKVSLATAFRVLPCLTYSGPLLSEKIRG